MNIDEALAEVRRGSAEIIDDERIVELVKVALQDGKEFTVKAGFDPTAPDLHLGHTVLLNKLASLQRIGARVQFLIGDFTARIGDPTGKSETRKPLTTEQIEQNAKSYKEQVFKILDPDRTTIVFNSNWIEPLGAKGLLELTTLSSVARMLERDDFEKRYRSGATIAISEFLYPLLQGYDSVHLKSDIEIGGTDQKFNLLMGRQLQRSYALDKSQAVIMMPILEGLDGVQKMSKSLNNFIAVNDKASDMFGKILSISDELMWRYYELLSHKSLLEIEQLKDGVASNTKHPKKVKELLAFEIVERFHSADDAHSAKAEFDKVHAKKELPDNIEEFDLEDGIWIAKALVQTKLSSSSSQARREIKQGALKIDQVQIKDEQLKLSSGSYVLQVGKRKFAKVKVS